VVALGDQLKERFPDNEMITKKFVPELVDWMSHAI